MLLENSSLRQNKTFVAENNLEFIALWLFILSYFTIFNSICVIKYYFETHNINSNISSAASLNNMGNDYEEMLKNL